MAAATMRRGGGMARFVAFMMLLVVSALFMINNQGHANRKHIEAPMIRSSYKSGSCLATSLYYSFSRGTVLVLCQLDDDEFGGMVFRFTEYRDGATTVLYDDAYEATCFAGTRAYWKRVLKRDGYVLLASEPTIESAFNAWLSMNL